jgi:hypothetical protein
VLTKARRYGELDLPLVIAVNVNTLHLHQSDASQALFGQEPSLASLDADHLQHRLIRANNGAWYGPSGPRARRCSGAWLFDRLTVYTLQHHKHTLYLNPWANQQLPAKFLRMPHALFVGEKIHTVGGVTFRDALEIYDQ